MKLKSIRRRVENTYKARFTRTPEVVGAVVDRCHEVDSRTRIIDRVCAGTTLPELSTRPLARMAEGVAWRRTRWAGTRQRAIVPTK